MVGQNTRSHPYREKYELKRILVSIKINLNCLRNGFSIRSSENNIGNYNKKNIYLINTLLITNYICYHVMEG